MSYRPLTANSSLANIIIKSPELGELKYPLSLRGLSSQTIKSLQPIGACLGSDKIVTFSFTNFLKKATQYAVKVEKYFDNSPIPMDFIPEQAIINALPADPIKGTEIVSSIKFEPYLIAETKAILRVTSPDGGEYTWVLTGQGHPPQAQVFINLIFRDQ